MLQSLPTGLKFGISIIFDFLDFTIGRIPGFGTIWDIFGGILSMLLWGPIGALAFLEVLDVTDQLDAEVPSLTLCGLLTLVRGGR